MVNQIKITDEQKFSCEYMVNGKLISKSPEKTVHEFDVVELPCKVQIMLNPYKIKPTVRIDDIMVNYGLAEITPWDHMIEFTIGDNFQQEYFQAIIDAKKTYLKKNGDTVPSDMEYFVGINNLHPEIIESISNNLK